MSHYTDPLMPTPSGRTAGTLGFRAAAAAVGCGHLSSAFGAQGVIGAQRGHSRLRYLALHDRRLAGGVPARPWLYIVNTDGSTPLAAAFHEINATARWAGKIHTMFILCHGYAGEDIRARVSMDAGGMGLELGKEDMLHTNVDRWVAIRDRVENIVVYSCAAADTERGNEGTTADGRYLMGALAIYTNADVYAADRIQWYNTWQNKANGAFDWGAWEGKLWHFRPDGAPPAKMAGRAPVEFGDVLTGSAP